jgi:predicted transcriptional regulator of viral defense system
MGSRAIGDRKKDYTSKAELLLFIGKEQIVSQVQVEAEFGLREEGARSKLHRLWKKGFIEPLGIEPGKWVLSPRGVEYVEYLKECCGNNR